MNWKGASMKTTYHLLKWIVVLTLVTTALAKIVSAFGSSPILAQEDGVIGISNKWLFLGVAIIELCLAAYLILGKQILLQSNLLLWLGTGFGIYRTSKWWLNIPEPCSCLGSVTDWFPAIQPYVEPIMMFSMGCIFLCAIALRLQHKSQLLRG